MIQLICRWMCPESLHVYRRVGATEHDRHIRAAMTARIDVMQAVNTPRVAADHGYAELVQGLQGRMAREAQREYDLALRTVMQEQNAPEEEKIAQRSATPRRRRQVIPLPAEDEQPAQTAPNLQTLEEAPSVGDAVFVPRACWPSYPCDEHAGTGWSGTVRSKTRYTALVSFDRAQTAKGVPYADERLDWMALKKIV